MSKFDKCGRIEGYAILFGSPDQRDLQGEYFTKETELHIDDKYPIRVETDEGYQSIGSTIDIVTDDKGVFLKGELDLSIPFTQAVMELLDSDVLFLAPCGERCLTDADGKIKSFPLRGIILTATPAQPPGNEDEDNAL